MLVPPALVVSPFPAHSWGTLTVEFGEVSMTFSHVANFISPRDNLDNLPLPQTGAEALPFCPTSSLTGGASLRYDLYQDRLQDIA